MVNTNNIEQKISVAVAASPVYFSTGHQDDMYLIRVHIFLVCLKMPQDESKILQNTLISELFKKIFKESLPNGST